MATLNITAVTPKNVVKPVARTALIANITPVFDAFESRVGTKAVWFNTITDIDGNTLYVVADVHVSTKNPNDLKVSTRKATVAEVPEITD